MLKFILLSLFFLGLHHLSLAQDDGFNSEYLMVMGGSTAENERLDSVDIHTLDSATSPLPQCLMNPPQLPMAVSHQGVAYQDGFVTLCGGTQDDVQNRAECYEWGPGSASWVEVGRMNAGRDNPAIVYDSNWGYWTIGGSGAPTSVESSSDRGRTWRDEAFLPEPFQAHCAVILDQDRLFVTGSEGASASYLYSRQSGQWEPRAQMLQPRGFAGSGCGTVTNPISGDLEVVAAGGNFGREEGFTDLVTIYNVRTDQWRESPVRLPEPLYSHAVVYKNTFILASGRTNPSGDTFVMSEKVFRYEPDFEGWTVLEPTVVPGRRYHAALMIDDTLC